MALDEAKKKKTKKTKKEREKKERKEERSEVYQRRKSRQESLSLSKATVGERDSCRQTFWLSRAGKMVKLSFCIRKISGSNPLVLV